MNRVHCSAKIYDVKINLNNDEFILSAFVANKNYTLNIAVDLSELEDKDPFELANKYRLKNAFIYGVYDYHQYLKIGYVKTTLDNIIVVDRNFPKNAIINVIGNLYKIDERENTDLITLKCKNEEGKTYFINIMKQKQYKIDLKEGMLYNVTASIGIESFSGVNRPMFFLRTIMELNPILEGEINES